MPKAFQDDLSQDSSGINNKENRNDQFARDFDKRPNLKMFTKGFNPKANSVGIPSIKN